MAVLADGSSSSLSSPATAAAAAAAPASDGADGANGAVGGADCADTDTGTKGFTTFFPGTLTEAYFFFRAANSVCACVGVGVWVYV